MKRDYSTGIDQTDIELFVGNEIEHTPAYGKRTLFVVGMQDAESIATHARDNECEHIYLGANMSFGLSKMPYGTEEEQDQWDHLVFTLLDYDFWVTLDFDIKYSNWISESGYTERDRFIPMISAKLPYIDQLGYNACLKLDDSDFRASNFGVWVHQLHTLKDPRVFTTWDKYTSDQIIK